MGILSKIFGQKLIDNRRVAEVISQNIEPSNLQNFGGKTIWACIKSNSTEEVLKSLPLLELEKSNWLDGLEKVQSFSNYEYIFISEPFDNWVLILGWGLPTPLNTGIEDISNLLNNLSEKFTESQFFTSQRTTDSAAWIKSINGEIKRAYVISDGMSIIIGEPTKTEENYKFVDLNSPDSTNDEYFETHIYPELKEVARIADSWSINPMEIEKYDSKKNGIGYLGKLKR